MNNSRTMSRQYSEYSDFFQHNENEHTNEMQTSPRGSPLKSDGVDGTGDTNQSLVLVAHRTTGRGGQATLGSIQTHSLRRLNSRRVVKRYPCADSIVAEEWMDWFVLDLVECPSVSRTSAVARTFGPAVSEEYSPVALAGGGGGCRCIPPCRGRVRYSCANV